MVCEVRVGPDHQLPENLLQCLIPTDRHIIAHNICNKELLINADSQQSTKSNCFRAKIDMEMSLNKVCLLACAECRPALL